MTAFVALYQRAVREVLRVVVTTTVIPIVLPVFVITIFAKVYTSVVQIPGFTEGDNYTSYIAPAALLMGTMLASPTTGVSTAVEIQTGYYDRFRVSPLGTHTTVLGRRAGDFTRFVFFAVVLTVVAALSGAAIENWPLALAVSGGLAAAWAVAYGGFPLAVCLRSGSADASQAFIPLFFPILFMSTAFLPLDLLPSWLKPIARVNPASAITDAIRESYRGVVGGRLGVALLGIAVVAAISEAFVQRARRARDAA